jgi:hypothetical protein
MSLRKGKMPVLKGVKFKFGAEDPRRKKMHRDYILLHDDIITPDTEREEIEQDVVERMRNKPRDPSGV